MTMSDKELEPCPLCGKDAEKTTAFGRKAIACTECYLVLRSEHICTKDYTELEAQWNLRQPDTEIVEASSELVLMLEECATLANAAISSTPTSDYRDMLCDLNIKRVAVIAKYKERE
jgi:hypothetical protein